MKNSIYILPISLCCLAALGQQQPADSTAQTNVTQSAAQTNATQASEASQLEDQMLAKFKKHEGWVKLTAAIEKKTPMYNKMVSQTTKLGRVISAKLDAKEDATPQVLELGRLRQTRSTMLREIQDLKKQREVIETEIRQREADKK